MAPHDNILQAERLNGDVDAACHDLAALQAELEAVMAAAHRLETRLTRINLSLNLRKGLVKPATLVPRSHGSRS